MATKAKKTTVKKPVSKTTRVATAKRSAKTTARRTVATKKVAKPAAAVKAPAASNKTRARVPLTPLERLRSIHIANVLTSIFFMVMSVVFLSNASSEALLGIQARDAFANLDQVVLGSAHESLASVQYKYLLAVMLGVSAIGSLLLATKLRRRYESTVSASVSGFRWLLFGITAGLTLELVSFIGGVQDVMTLKTVFALVVATTIFGWIADRDNVGSARPKWLAYGASVFTGTMAWMPLVGSLIGTTMLGDERFGWHVYALVAVTLTGFIGFALNQRASIRNKKALTYTAYEQRYLRIDQVTRAAVVIIIFSAFAR